MSQPSAPGVSVDLSGAARVAARRLRGLGKAFPIDFTTKEGTENELMTWYRSRSCQFVRTLQLRREREGPYFHQFIVFELTDGGGLFRIDRRLRPDEDSPMNSLKDEGIPAYDTIEPVASWDDTFFPTSDCLISIDFPENVYLALILKICQVIQGHPLAKVYTLQRYNCYFFAQTIMLWAACGAVDWASTRNWPPEWVPTLNSNKGFLELNKPSHEHADYSKLGHISPPFYFTTQFTYKGHILTLILTRRTSLPQLKRSRIHSLQVLTPSWVMDDVKFLLNKIDASVQHLLETYWEEGPIHRILRNYVMDTNIWEISEDFRSSFRSMPKFGEIVIELRSVQEARLGSGQTGALIFQAPSFVIRPTPTTIINRPQLYQMESFGIRLSNRDQWKEFIVKMKCWKELSAEFGPLGQAQERIHEACLDSFEQNMKIRIVCGAIAQQDTSQDTTPNSNLEDIPRYRRPRRTIFRWRKAKQEQRMRPATIIDMQKYLLYLIDSHSIRVEQYKWATKAIATDVAVDIRRAMDEVWDKLIE
ncbi:unnamed protein product [Rhizoctonia solani]|uniref:Uncharacterized protein n=2 Tax=Rhizoctonia solani TaxID=456999 RepID=A0A8H3BA32_9AGAM|nr:unnamed protein product [Rhizoctonia solani]